MMVVIVGKTGDQISQDVPNFLELGHSNKLFLLGTIVLGLQLLHKGRIQCIRFMNIPYNIS